MKTRTKILLVILAIIFIIAELVEFSKVEKGKEAEWSYYIRHFGSVETGVDARSVLGEPLQIERDFDSQDTDRVIYSRLYYDGYSLGVHGRLESEICNIRIYEKGIMPLRNGVDIGSTRKEVEAAYWNAAEISDTDGYILKHRKEHFYEGIWIRFCFDDDDRLVEYSVTDGF